MLELKERTYTIKELENFKREVVDNKNRDANYLLENISALKILGYQIKLGTRLKNYYMLQFWEVLKFDSQLKAKTMLLYIPKKELEACPDCKTGKVIAECSCRGRIGNKCTDCNGDWKNLKVICPTCKGTRKVEKDSK